jgi:hypothetical protein
MAAECRCATLECKAGGQGLQALGTQPPKRLFRQASNDGGVGKKTAPRDGLLEVYRIDAKGPGDGDLTIDIALGGPPPMLRGEAESGCRQSAGVVPLGKPIARVNG